MPKPPYPLFAGLVFGAALGFALGGLSNFATSPDRRTVESLEAVPVSAELAHADDSLTNTRTSPTAASANDSRDGMTDPVAWLQAWVSAGAPGEHRSQAEKMVKQWSRTDPRSALAFVAHAPRFPMRHHAFVIALEAIGQKEPAWVENWIRANVSDELRGFVIDRVTERIGEVDPARALEFALLNNHSAEPYRMADLITKLAKQAPGRALSYFNQLPEGSKTYAADEFAAAWFAQDPEAAMQWCAQLRGTDTGQKALQGILQVAAAKPPEYLSKIISRFDPTAEEFPDEVVFYDQPETMMALLPFLPERQRHEAVAFVIRHELENDPDLALQLAHTGLPADDRREAILRGWQNWIQSDTKAAKDWAEKLGDPALKKALLGDTLDQLLQKDPRQFLAQVNGSDPKREDQIHQALLKVANADLPAAANWIERRAGSIPAETIGRVTTLWLRKDEQATWQWISTLTDANDRDAALGAAIDFWAGRKDVALTTAALLVVNNPRIQTALRWSAARRFYARDPVAARQWLAGQPLSPEVRENWVSILEYQR